MMNWKNFEYFNEQCSFLLKNERYNDFAEQITCLEGHLAYKMSEEGVKPSLLSLLKSVSLLKQKFGKRCHKNVYDLTLRESK